MKGKIAHGPPPTGGVKVNSYASCHYRVQDMSPNIDIKMVLHSENVFLKGLKAFDIPECSVQLELSET